MAFKRNSVTSVQAALLLFAGVIATTDVSASQRQKVSIPSTLDGSLQPCYLVLPDDFDPDGAPVPLLVTLHTWSADVEQRSVSQVPLERMANEHGWVFLFPHFRGANKHPDACGSEKAQQDILDAVGWVRERFPIDSQRIYLTGTSGGGHMTMLMVGRHPEPWAAASAWVGISDLAAWHRLHASDNYGAMLRRSCGGAPGASPDIDEQYRKRSPLTFLHRAARVPVDIAAGIQDGHQGSVPVRHSIDAFNVIAKAAGGEVVSEEEIEQLSRRDGRLESPRASDQAEDPILGRKIYLRRIAGQSRITIFEGGHECVPEAAFAWLERHVKPN
jgi:dipeptidyl aminopeptidase/acylaminoacyl peptidase